ncbi:MAG: MaoC family dehydratase [Pseudomonadota bacterium]
MTEIGYDNLAALIGRQLGVSDWIVLDQEMIDRFAEATGDRQWIHVDRLRAERELGSTIAHGFLTLSLIPRLGDPMLTVAGARHRLNYGLDKVRFTSPVPAGSRVRMIQTVAEVEPKGGGMLLHLDCVFELDGQERPACIARQLVQFVPDAD